MRTDSDKLRDRATRLFAMALNAREQGFGSADTDLANEALAQADEIDRADHDKTTIAAIRPSGSAASLRLVSAS
jgi:hypothetical protein